MHSATHKPFVQRAAELWPAALIVAAGFAAYANSFNVPFVFDDVPSITGNVTIREWRSALAPPLDGTGVVGRPIINLSLALNYEPDKFHVFDDVLMCAHHVAMFRLDDGECFDGPCQGSRLTPIEIESRADALFVR